MRAAEAIERIRSDVKIDCVDPQPPSHWGVLISSIDTDDCMGSIGVYATALIAQIVGVDLVLSDALIGNRPAFTETLTLNVERTIGPNNELDDDFRRYQRDPWITEALGHLLFALAKDVASDCVPGPVRALTLPHTQVREQGLDLVGVFELDDGNVGICITESKASETNAGSQLAKAAKLFRALDDGERDADVLQALNLFRGYLAPNIRDALPDAMWTGERSYAPLLSFRTNFDPATARESTLGRLAPPVDRRRVIAVELQNYRAFFDGVADGMRAAAAEY